VLSRTGARGRIKYDLERKGGKETLGICKNEASFLQGKGAWSIY
jgi:hypothetical protein